jgi:hypothetical protein
LPISCASFITSKWALVAVLGDGIVWDGCLAARVGAGHLHSFKNFHLRDEIERSGNSTFWAMLVAAYTTAATTQSMTPRTLWSMKRMVSPSEKSILTYIYESMFTEQNGGCSKALHEEQLRRSCSIVQTSLERLKPELLRGLYTQTAAWFS